MKLAPESIRLLGLSTNELKVFTAIRSGSNTPLTIAKRTGISRPAVYEILERLHKRRLIKSNIVSGRKYWSQAKDQDLEKELYETKNALLNVAEGVEEVKGMSDSAVLVHRGTEAVQKVLLDLTKEHSSQRIRILSGENIVPGWEKNFGPERINEFNRQIKKQGIISELVLSEDWFRAQFNEFGKSWATDLEGRTAVAHKIDAEYLSNAGQIFIFKKSLYLISMNEALVIEIRNSEIQKLVLSLFEFIQDHSRKFDLNAMLRELLSETKQ